MKSLTIIICALFLSFNSSFAQFSGVNSAAVLTGRISGTIVDSVTNKPVDYATVSLSKNGQIKSTNGALADDKGFFKIESVKAGKYRITITFIGYNTKIIEPVITTDNKLDLNLGNIQLSTNSKMLKEVVVEGQASIIENKIDKLVYNAEKDMQVAGGSATDVLRKVPLLSVDFDGNVSLRGSTSITVLINGKPSGTMSSNIADALKGIPADQIKSVEVITSPSAKYDAEGSTGIINIITKKSNLEGMSGSVNLGVGTRQNSGNANLNSKTGRLSLTSNIGGNFMWPTTSIITSSRANINRDTLFDQIGGSTTKRGYVNGSLGADYDFNKYNSLSSSIKLNRFQFAVDGSNLNQYILGSKSFSFNRNSDNNNKVLGYDWNNSFTHKFKKEGQEISAAAQVSNSNLINDYTSGFVFNSIIPDSSELGNSTAKNHETTFQIDYVQPFKKVVLETGAKTILRNISNDSKVDSYFPQTNTTNSLSGRNYVYNYSQDVYAAYATFGFTLAKKYGFKLGGRYEETHINGAATGVSTSSPVVNTYRNFVPSVVVSRSFKNFQTVKLSYNKRLQRPSIFYLNPFRNSADPLNQSEGNPTLSPELADNVELNYSTFIKSTIINTSVYYRHTSNVIESVVKNLTLNPGTSQERNISLSTYENVGNNNSVGFNFFGSINPIKKLTLRTNFNVYSYDINLGNNSVNYSANQNQVYLMYNAYINATVILPKSYTFETFLITNSPRRSFQGTYPSFNMWSLGAKKEIWKKKGSIGINVIDPFNQNKNFTTKINSPYFNQTSNYSVPFRSVGVSFSWKFGQLKVQDSKKGVKNDDQKQGDSQGLN
jgi:ferric enterobactin receptor